MQEFASGSTLFGGNAPYIEEQYERYLADPDDVSRRVAGVFRLAARRRGGRRARAGRPVVHRARQAPQGRRRDGRRVDDAQAGARAAADRQVPHARDVPRRPRSAEAAGAALHRGSRPRDLRLHRRPTSTPSSTSARSRPAPTRMRLRRPHRRAAGDVLPHVRRRVHVHLGHADQALHPGAARADSRAARRIPPRSSGTSSSG